MKTIANLILMAALASAAARADIIITLDDPNQTAGPGEMLNFFGTISNTSLDTDPADAVYLNADTLNFSLLDATVDDNFFASYFPVSLSAGQSSGDIDLFDIVLANPETQPFGVYTGIYGLLGGMDGGAQTAQDNFAHVSFSVSTQATSPTPEPGTLGLLSIALATIAGPRWIRSRSSPAGAGRFTKSLRHLRSVGRKDADNEPPARAGGRPLTPPPRPKSTCTPSRFKRALVAR